jgi:hypothetical protein
MEATQYISTDLRVAESLRAYGARRELAERSRRRDERRAAMRRLWSRHDRETVR